MSAEALKPARERGATRQELIQDELYPGRMYWEYTSRPYLRVGDNFIGPFRSFTAAYRHRRDFGPAEAWLTQMGDHQFIGTLFPPKSPEQHRWEIAQS